MTPEEAIYRIEKVYLATYDPNSPLSVYDQLAICESIGLPPYDDYIPTKTDGDALVNRMGNDTYKRSVNFQLTQSKEIVITKLKEYNYRTPPIHIASLLNEFFDNQETWDGHWLFIAQHWTPRTILRVIHRLIKLQTTGMKSIRNPPGYFTYLIKMRKKRKEYQ